MKTRSTNAGRGGMDVEEDRDGKHTRRGGSSHRAPRQMAWPTSKQLLPPAAAATRLPPAAAATRLPPEQATKTHPPANVRSPSHCPPAPASHSNAARPGGGSTPAARRGGAAPRATGGDGNVRAAASGKKLPCRIPAFFVWTRKRPPAALAMQGGVFLQARFRVGKTISQAGMYG